ncbi:MAG: argininosuccinate lyase, partial [Pseudomonadota bacterium]
MALLWGGRFSKAGDSVLWEFTVSPADRRLLKYDLEGSKAHVRMLAHSGLISSQEQEQLLGGLEQIQAEAAQGGFEFRDSDEDVHSAVERRLTELAGEVAGKLHTGRSRNDQVALDLRLYLRNAVHKRVLELAGLAETLVRRSEDVIDIAVPAYTHLQQAQVIPLSHHLLAYAWMFSRDLERFRDAEKRIAVSPLGAGAAAGSSLPLDPEFSAAELGLPRTFENSMDAVASRDFAAEYVFCAAQAMAHLSRLGEEFVLWSTKEFGWITLPDELSTGSSMLPQKKNPDIAELARGKCAGVIGDVTALLALQKGLPLAYNRDLQEDKPSVFHADDTLASTVKAVTAL